MNKALWKEHGLTHNKTSEFINQTRRLAHTPWHQLDKSKRRAIIEHSQTCKNYTKIFLSFFVLTVIAASVISIRQELKSDSATQQQTQLF